LQSVFGLSNGSLINGPAGEASQQDDADQGHQQVGYYQACT
jgi:hypothetical protein